MMLDIGRIEAYCLVRCCHCRMAEIDAGVMKLMDEFVDNGGKLDPVLLSAVIALDGERYIVEQALGKLWKHAKGPANK